MSLKTEETSLQLQPNLLYMCRLIVYIRLIGENTVF